MLPRILRYLRAHIFGIGAGVAFGIFGELGQERQAIHGQTVGWTGVHDLAQDGHPQALFQLGQVQRLHFHGGFAQIPHQWPGLEYLRNIFIALYEIGSLQPGDRRAHLGVGIPIFHFDARLNILITKDFTGGNDHLLALALGSFAEAPQDLANVAARQLGESAQAKLALAIGLIKKKHAVRPFARLSPPVRPPVNSFPAIPACRHG